MEDQVKKLVMSMLAYAVQRDIPAEVLCRLSNVSMEELKDEEKVLSDKQLNDVWLNALHLTRDQLFGLHFGESLQLSALGIVGEIIKASGTVGDALTIAASLTPLITTAFCLKITSDEQTFSIRFVPQLEDWEQHPALLQTLDFLIVFAIHELDGLLLKKVIPLSVSYAIAKDEVNEYTRVMRCAPIFNAGENSITFDQCYWNEPILSANFEMQRFLVKKLQPFTEMTLKEPATLQRRISNYLMSNSYLGIISQEQIASNFNISTRTLQRKLKEEGVNFQQLADDARKSLAIDYLKSGSYPIKQVSYMLGYNEIPAFIRSFKRWTGTTPAVYQTNNK
ncbi:AraC family transcriptional regulator [Pedobacter caeni]|uniref:AraC-type DNA-binding protein n=1 Tax=Pedobacter caeni TaxID=288992 RepID=A0A1M5AV24_9SPHI|nr:AraC family transcriptional regulator [Pedobacter caeni]SHF34055.1 AraC-type DNA-binding protein [Pedobacter caeni]